MKVFFDSSAFVKKFVEEPGIQEAEDVCQKASMLGLSVICFTEIASVLNRKVREDKLSSRSYKKIKYQLAEDISDAHVINLLPEVIEKSIGLLERNVLRSLDALHVACALEWQADLFVSSDKRQVQTAEKSALQVKYIPSD